VKRLKGLEPSTFRMASVDVEPAIRLSEIRDGRYATDDSPGASGADESRATNGPIRRSGWRVIAILESDRPGGSGR
jgi:hypothetical protein